MSRTFSAGLMLGKYELERRLGRGAFGEVWLASEQSALGMKRKAALKIITSVTNERKVKDLLHEARLCGYLDHPHVISVHGVVQLPDAHFIVMEFIDGEDLAHLFRSVHKLGLRFPRSVLLDIAIAIASAIDHAWNAVDPDGTELKIVHRDMKPQNVMVSRQGQIKVTDFGIAKAAPDVTMTASGVLKGTPTYLAPEIWTGSRDLGPRVDLFSLGIILWEMAVGQRFFGKTTITGVMDLLAERTGESEAALVRPLLPGLEPVVARLLDRNPADRYQDPAALLVELREIRQSVAAPGSVEDFVALVELVRAEAGEAARAEVALPKLVGELGDWGPLVEAASRCLPEQAQPGGDEVVADDAETRSESAAAAALRVDAPAANRLAWAIWGLGIPLAGVTLFLLLHAKGYL